MKTLQSSANGFRALSSDEIAGVAGGWDDGETIVVTGHRMTNQQATIWDSWRTEATWSVNAMLYGAVAAAGYFGSTGIAGAAAAVGVTLIGDTREDMIANLTDVLYNNDLSDGCLDGAIVPGGYSPPGGMRQYCQIQ